MNSCIFKVAVHYDEFRRHLHKAGLTLKEFAHLIEVKPASISNHKRSGHVPQLYAVAAVLLGHLGDEHTDFRELLHKHGIGISSPEPKAAPVQLKLIASRRGQSGDLT